MTHRSLEEDLSAKEIADQVNGVLSGDRNAITIADLMLKVETEEIPLFDGQLARYTDKTFHKLTDEISTVLGSDHEKTKALQSKLEEYYTLAPSDRPSFPSTARSATAEEYRYK